MVSVFAIFATLSMLEMKMMGVGLSAAILLDATLVRLVMLPGDHGAARASGSGGRGGRARPRGEVVSEPEPEYALAER